MAGQKVASGAGHRISSLKLAFCLQKCASKRQQRPYIATLFSKINALGWSDPE